MYHAGRNVTADNYFTDFALALELLLKKTIYVSTLRKNKSDIPPELQANKRRPVGSTLFGFDKDTTLVSYVPKMSKSVLLVSTMHHDDKIDEQTGKPDIILYYSIIILREQWIQWIRCVTPTACRGRLKDGLLLIS